VGPAYNLSRQRLTPVCTRRGVAYGELGGTRHSRAGMRVYALRQGPVRIGYMYGCETHPRKYPRTQVATGGQADNRYYVKYDTLRERGIPRT